MNNNNNNNSCVSNNPMNSMLKQFGHDQSLQRDRFKDSSQYFIGKSSIRTQKQESSSIEHDKSMMNEFFGHNPQYDSQISSDNFFGYSKLHHQLNLSRQANQTGGWTNEFAYQINPIMGGLTTSEKGIMEKAFSESKVTSGKSQKATAWSEGFIHYPDLTNINQSQLMGFEPNFHKKVDWTHGFDLQIKGRETMLLSEDFTWEEQFSAFDIKGATSPTTDASTDDSITYDDDNLLQNTADEPLEGNNWGDEFGSFNDLGAVVNTPNLGEYIFEPSNPFLSHPNPALEGVRLLEDGYSLTDVALAFEAAVQKDPEDSQAWTNLGNTQAQNEKNIPAIRALEKAVAITPGNLDALMFLSVCYTNESYDHAAYMTLERWITLKYPSVLKHHPLSDKASSFELQTRTTDLFLTIARQTPDAENMDPDVQVGLGVLFYGCGDLDKAVDCFISALKSRPDDYLLWNRVGATLANNGRGEEAIDAYQKALEIRPSFVRARYNIGISCINIGCYKEAAEHILMGISMNKRGLSSTEEGLNVSSKSWDMLKKALIRMDRHDLANKAITGADLSQFRSEFDF